MRALNCGCAVESLEERRLFDTTVPIVDVASAVVRYTDLDGTDVTLRTRGATGSYTFITDVVPMQKGRTITLPGMTDLRAVNLAAAVSGTPIRSFSLTGKGGNGTVNLPQTTISGSIGLFGAKSATLSGALDIQGTCGRLLLDGAAEGSSITLGAVDEIRISSECFSSIQLGVTGGVVDFINRIHVGGRVSGVWDINFPVRSVYGGEFDEDFEGEFDDVGSFRVGGDFRGSISGHTFVGMYVGRDMIDAELGFFEVPEEDEEDYYALEYLTVKGVIDGTVYSSIGSLGDVRAACIKESIFFAGINAEGLSAQNRIPNTPLNFGHETEVRSIRISARSALGFSDTVFGAKSFGDLRLGRVFTTNGGRPFGIGTTMARSVTGTFFGAGSDMRFRFTDLGSGGDFAQQAAAQGLQTGDFQVRHGPF